jgi:hypothetical protein
MEPMTILNISTIICRSELTLENPFYSQDDPITISQTWVSLASYFILYLPKPRLFTLLSEEYFGHIFGLYTGSILQVRSLLKCMNCYDVPAFLLFNLTKAEHKACAFTSPCIDVPILIIIHIPNLTGASKSPRLNSVFWLYV